MYLSLHVAECLEGAYPRQLRDLLRGRIDFTESSISAASRRTSPDGPLDRVLVKS